MERSDLENRFPYRDVTTAIESKSETVRLKAMQLAEILDHMAPDGREKSLAMTKLEECFLWAKAAIERDPAERVNKEH